MNKHRDPDHLERRMDAVEALQDAIIDNYDDEDDVPDRHVLPFMQLRVWQTILITLIAAVAIVAIVYFSVNGPITPAGAEQAPAPTAKDIAKMEEQFNAAPATSSAVAALPGISERLYKWRYHIGDDAYGTQIGPTGLVLTRSANGNTLFAVREGELQWSHALGGYDMKELAYNDNGDVALRTMNAVLLLDGASGKQLWRNPATELELPSMWTKPSAGPIVDSSGNTYFIRRIYENRERAANPGVFEDITQSGLQCISPEGRLLWQAGFDGDPGSELLLGPDGNCYFTCEQNNRGNDPGVAAVDSQGRKLWEHRFDEDDVDGFSMLQLSDSGRLLAIGGKSHRASSAIHCLDPQSGKLHWKHDNSQLHLYAMLHGGAVTALHGDTFYVSGYRSGNTSESVELFAIDITDGSVKWSIKCPNRPTGRMDVGPDGRIYLVTHYLMSCISPEGKILWQLHENGYIFHEARFGPDGLIYVRSQGRLHALRPDGTEVFRLPTSQQELVMDKDGTFYTVEDGELVAFTP